MKLVNYKITNIDTDNQTISFVLNFDDQTIHSKTISYQDVAFDDMDKDGNKFLNFKPAFDITKDSQLEADIESYAQAYINGIEATKSPVIAPSVQTLVNKVITPVKLIASDAVASGEII